jgi:hypothetical protein
MVIPRVKLLVSGDARSTMLNAGRKGDMMYSFQLVRTLKSKGVSVLKDFEGMVSRNALILTSVRRKANVSVQTACVPTSGVAITANVQTRCCISMSMTPASVRRVNSQRLGGLCS